MIKTPTEDDEKIVYFIPRTEYFSDLHPGDGQWGLLLPVDPRVVPNFIMKAKSEKRRAFVGDQVDDCQDLSSLFFLLPFQKGYLVNWDHQKTVCDYVFGKECFNLRPDILSPTLTSAQFRTGRPVRNIFEEYGFKSLLRTHPGDLSCYRNKIQFSIP